MRANKEVLSQEDCLFIAQNGTGDQLCFKLMGDAVDNDVYLWDHDSSSTSWVAQNLSDLIMNLK
ncbi:SMI1/KNR4 family protein [Alteribacter aurantiacus]|uniref:SMI1/KNR4 family protein n=1 Tax=Alteribacter aurantiacus TaxID=254410 RepID=UPI000685E27F